MGKVLRVFVVFILLLAIAALTLGSMLFAKRELLKGRTGKLEQGLLRVARTLEAASPAALQSPDVFPERDVSSVTAEVLESPTLGQFWSNYRQELEQLDNPLLDMNPKRRDLMSYYKINPVTSKPEPDPVTGGKIMDGPGTMQGVINEIIERSGEQYNLLTATRQQLKLTRTELVEAIKDLNQQKKTLRERLVHIVALNGEITKLNSTIADLRRELVQANERINEQQLRITDLEQEKLLLEEEKDTLKIKVEELAAAIKKIQQSGALVSGQRTDGSGTLTGRLAAGGDTEGGSATIAVGAKGRVVSVDQRHQFVVMEMDAGFITELLAASVDGKFPTVDLLVQRGEEQPKFITKVRLTQLKQDMNLAIGDILTDWQQGPIEFGDVVYYQ
jgi:hypothetical protein